MNQDSPSPWIITLTVFIVLGILCAGCFLTAPSWFHLLPNLPTRAARIPILTPIPSPTPTQYIVVTSTPRPAPSPLPTLGRRPAPVGESIPRPITRTQSGNPAACLFVLIVLGGVIAVAIYFTNKTGPARSPAGATLEQQIQWYMKKGFRLIHRTEVTAQLTRPKQFSFLLALVLLFALPLIGLIFYILYYMSQSDTAIYLQTEGDRVLITKS